jgi:hypothetical protein
MSIFEWVAKGKTADLLRAHPLEIAALVENRWRERAGEVGASPEFAWPESTIQQVLIRDFDKRLITPAELKQAELWPHLIYAYLIENTGIFEIFQKLSELYRLDSRLPPLKNDSRRFWFMVDSLIFSAPPPMTVLSAGALRGSDEQLERQALYRKVLNLELSNSKENAQHYQSRTPGTPTGDLISNIGAFLHETWRGIVQARPGSIGSKDVNYQKIVSSANAIRNQLSTQRERSDLSLAEFRAAGIMSLLEVAVSDNTAVVEDLNAMSSSAAERLRLIGKQCGIAPNPRAAALFEIAPHFSVLLRFIETDVFKDAGSVETLCKERILIDRVEPVISLYREALGNELTASGTELVAFPGNPRVRQRLLAP